MTGTGEGVYLHFTDNGKSPNEGSYIYGLGIQVSRGANATYTEAFNELMNSELGKQAPGMIRLLTVRAGADDTYGVLFSASTFAALNEYLDTFGESKSYENFLSKAGEISTVSGPSIYKVIKMWK
jgi:hypothetical protein